MSQAETLFSEDREITEQDTDPAGIVHPPYIAHFVVALVERWFAERLSADWTALGARTVFASLSCTFLSPMRPADILEARLALRRIGRSSLGFELVGHAKADDRLCWMAETVCVFVDRATSKSRPIPEQLRSSLKIEAELAISIPFADRTLTR